LFVGGDADEKATLTYGSYENKYVRTAQGWLISVIRLDIAYLLISA